MEGKVLAGRYRLQRQLGQGGMGSVWSAEHLTLQSRVAVKLLDPSIAQTAEGVERFQREARAAASLRSVHVVSVLDYGVEDGTPYLVMEQLQGESLADRILRFGVLTPAMTLQVITGVSKAMARAHSAGIVHRDLKPDNVFLVEEDGELIPKVLDFGIAKHTQLGPTDGVVTRTGLTMGTPYYMSPEQAEGKRSLDHRTDLWAIAVITCECLTGQSPFAGETLGEILLKICARPIPVPSMLGPVPPGFDEWFARGTQREPDARFGSAKELSSALGAVLQRAGDAAAPFAATAAVPAGGHHHSEAWPSTGNTNPGRPGTSGAVAVDVARSKSSGLPIALGAIGALAVAAAVAWLVWPDAASTEADPAALPALDDSVAAVSLAPSAASEQLPSVRVVDEPSSGVVATPPPSAAPVATTEASSANGATKPPSPPDLVESEPAPADPPSEKAAAATPKAPAKQGARPSKTLFCTKNGFTGQLELAAANAPDKFACEKDPFTGKLRRR